MKNKKLLMLGTSYGSCEMIRYAKKLGVYTIVTDPNVPEKSLAKKEADEYWMISTADIDQLEKKCREEGVNSVCCGISEFNLEIELELCKRLGLKAYCTPEAWHFSRDKDDFKKLCRSINEDIPLAKDYYISSELTDDELKNIVYPVVVKPVDRNGNRGISFCYNEEQLIEAYHYARSVSSSDKIIVERMLHGDEWYSMYAVANGEVSLLSLNALYAEPGEPKNCYTVSTNATNHINQFINEINPKIEKLLKAVGCTDGIAWVQTLLDEDGKFYVIEMGYRLDGEMFFTTYKNLCNFDALKWYVDIALGIEHKKEDLPKPQKEAYKKCSCAMELWVNKSGKIMSINGMDKIAKIPGVYVETLRNIGEEVDKYRSVGVITFTTNNCDEMCKMIEKVNETVSFINEKGEDIVIKYTNFDYLKKVYNEGLDGK